MLYKYCDEKGLDILKNVRLKISRLVDLNDPFEIPIRVADKMTIEEVLEDFRGDPEFASELIRKIGYPGPLEQFLSDDTLFLALRQGRIDFLQKTVNEHRERLRKDLGAICFSLQYDNPQMWYHYAGKNSGLVVGFEEGSMVDNPGSFFAIDYSDEDVVLPVVYTEKGYREGENSIRDSVLEGLKRKRLGWSHEKETRLYSDIRGALPGIQPYLPVPEGAISETYVGEKASDDLVKAVVDLRDERYPNMKVYRVRTSQSTLTLERERIA